MSYQGALDSPGSGMVYLMCIEGMGWPTSGLGDLSSFSGHVLITNDIDGSVASKLSGSFKEGLELPADISHSFSPRTTDYTPGGFEFGFNDVDGWMASYVRPHTVNGVESLLTVEYTLGDSSLTVDSSLGTFAEVSGTEDGLLWLAGAECATLTADNGSGNFDATRAALGTDMGRRSLGVFSASTAYTWPVGTKVTDYNPHWGGRRAILMAYAPGGASASVQILWMGKLTSPQTVDQNGTMFRFSCENEVIGKRPKRERSKYKFHVGGHVWTHATMPDEQTIFATGNPVAVSQWYDKIRHTVTMVPSPEARDAFTLQLAYNYRNRWPGGTDGAIAAVGNASPNTTVVNINGSNQYDMGSFVKIRGAYYIAMWQSMRDGAGQDLVDLELRNVRFSGLPEDDIEDPFAIGETVEFLLDNAVGANKRVNRFTVNNQVTYNIIDTALIFMTSGKGEYYVGDVASSTGADNATFSGVPGYTWDGYALHCVEGNNLGESRVITDGSGPVVVDRDFTGTPQANTEYHIRNSIYDVLPAGWGLGLGPNDIDIPSFEAIRTKHLKDVNVSEFIIGDSDDLDIWEFLQDNIFRPYGILTFRSTITGQLTAKYIGPIIGADGVDETYTAISADDIVSIGPIKYSDEPPVRRVEINIRDTDVATIRPKRTTWDPVRIRWNYEYLEMGVASAGGDPLTRKIEINTSELEDGYLYGSSSRDVIKLNALLNTSETSQWLAAHWAGWISRMNRPPPTTVIELDASWGPKVELGDVLLITDATIENPLNPLANGTRGWSGVAARITSKTISFESMRVIISVELYQQSETALVAPAAIVTSKGSDGNGAYFVVHDPTASATFENNPNGDDWYLFAVDDRINLKAQDGTVKEAEVIAGFGTNFVSDPTLATTGRIYVDGTIASTIVTGDYVTFSAWSTSNTTNMGKYAAGADASDGLGSTPDPSRKYT